MLSKTNITLDEFLSLYTEDKLDEFCSNNLQIYCIENCSDFLYFLEFDYENHLLTA